ncbi:AMP-binding protein [Ensifer adhaerens]|uniref:AMP-binding protein n=1 Tax=Ensifer adhaerens TaxID=106592 RepID=A0A0L8BIJ4_ENSAD|nr:AMP-binding protein [Ensifer adhaerens]KOF14403.1 AMP-binding protein [Ensifer adhaerens]
MKRVEVVSTKVESHDERRARIESEPLPQNIAALVRAATSADEEKLLWHFLATDEKMTYRDLEPTLNRLAAGFARAGIGRGVHVAVMLPNIAAMPLSWLAIGMLGAVMVPVNNSYSKREVEYVIGNSEATFVITSGETLSLVEEVISAGATKLRVENVIVVGDDVERPHHSFSELVQTDPSGLILPDVGHDDLLNIQYTSGTTGFPKGCMLTQRYWLSAGKVNAFRDGRAYRKIFASTPFYYMDPQWLLLMSLYQGATLIVEKRQSASRFMSWIRDNDIEFCLLPVLTLKQDPSPLDSQNKVIRANVYGVPTHLHTALEERFDLCAREAFGMTEIGPTLYVPIEATQMVGSGSCGIPCPFRECKIVDESGHEVAHGTVGELVVRGLGIMTGYYNNPQATQAAFRDGWFRTGDLFRQDAGGFFYIVGRIKDTIRRSGENIAAREVESVLLSCDLVSEAAAIPVKDPVRGEEIKAIIVWQEGISGVQDNLEALIDHCRGNLAPFKVPRYFETRQALPKTGSSKVAKHLLVAESEPLANTFDRQAQPAEALAGGVGNV